jgi:hypothetical protein
MDCSDPRHRRGTGLPEGDRVKLDAEGETTLFKVVTMAVLALLLVFGP